jgi:hypothetical protein
VRPRNNLFFLVRPKLVLVHSGFDFFVDFLKKIGDVVVRCGYVGLALGNQV